MLLLSSLILSSSSRRGETRRSSPTTTGEEERKKKYYCASIPLFSSSFFHFVKQNRKTCSVSFWCDWIQSSQWAQFVVVVVVVVFFLFNCCIFPIGSSQPTQPFWFTQTLQRKKRLEKYKKTKKKQRWKGPWKIRANAPAWWCNPEVEEERWESQNKNNNNKNIFWMSRNSNNSQRRERDQKWRKKNKKIKGLRGVVVVVVAAAAIVVLRDKITKNENLKRDTPRCLSSLPLSLCRSTIIVSLLASLVKNTAARPGYG